MKRKGGKTDESLMNLVTSSLGISLKTFSHASILCVYDPVKLCILLFYADRHKYPRKHLKFSHMVNRFRAKSIFCCRFSLSEKLDAIRGLLWRSMSTCYELRLKVFAKSSPFFSFQFAETSKNFVETLNIILFDGRTSCMHAVHPHMLSSSLFSL